MYPIPATPGLQKVVRNLLAMCCPMVAPANIFRVGKPQLTIPYLWRSMRPHVLPVMNRFLVFLVMSTSELCSLLDSSSAIKILGESLGFQTNSYMHIMVCCK